MAVKTRTAPSASCTVASLMAMAGGPPTVADVDWDSFLLSSVQIAPLASQSVVSGRVMLTEPFPSGSTSTVQPWLLPWVFRLALAMAPPLTVNASSRILA